MGRRRVHDPAERSPDAQTLRMVWILIGSMAIGAVALWLGPARMHITQPGFSIPLAAFVLIVVATDYPSVVFEFRRQTLLTTFCEISTVIALSLCTPLTMLIGGVVGFFVVQLAQRYPPLKITFNIAARALQLGVSRAALAHFAGGRNILSPRGALMVFAAVALGDFVNRWPCLASSGSPPGPSGARTSCRVCC